MGTWHYDDHGTVYIEDNLLAHLQILLITKLRRSEAFLLSWADGDDGRRSTVWIAPHVPYRFVYESADRVAVDAERLKAMMHAASSTGGLVLGRLTDPEPGPAPSSASGNSSSPAEPPSSA